MLLFIQHEFISHQCCTRTQNNDGATLRIWWKIYFSDSQKCNETVGQAVCYYGYRISSAEFVF